MTDQLKKQIADLTNITEYQDTLLRECNKAMHENMRLLDEAANPHWFGKSWQIWNQDRHRHMIYMKNLLVRIRARNNGFT